MRDGAGRRCSAEEPKRRGGAMQDGSKRRDAGPSAGPPKWAAARWRGGCRNFSAVAHRARCARARCPFAAHGGGARAERRARGTRATLRAGRASPDLRSGPVLRLGRRIGGAAPRAAALACTRACSTRPA
eukprot:gene17957-8434_t